MTSIYRNKQAVSKLNSSNKKQSKSTKSRPKKTDVKTTNKNNSDIEGDFENSPQYTKEKQYNTPDFAKIPNVRDQNLKRYDEVGYDPTTLYVPPDFYEKQQPLRKQYWKIKSANFDKIVLFKVGKFYEIFYDDSDICHKELDLQYMGNDMAHHVGFPERALDKFASLLSAKGYKICIVEQTETPEEMKQRISNEKNKTKGEKLNTDKIVNREIVKYITRGTDQKDNNVEPKILLSVVNTVESISFTFLDITTNTITMGFLPNSDNYSMFKTMIMNNMPVEIIYQDKSLNFDLKNIFFDCPTRPTLSPLNIPEAWSIEKVKIELDNYHNNLWPKNLKTAYGLQNPHFNGIPQTLASIWFYLKKLLIADTVFKAVKYEVYDTKKISSIRMILDSQALQHLEIFEVQNRKYLDQAQKNSLVGLYSNFTADEGSLLYLLDKTTTPYGKRLLKKWVCAPLLNTKAINNRLDAVEELGKDMTFVSNFRKLVAGMPDLERICARICKYSVKITQKIILFEDVSTARLKEFRKIAELLHKIRNFLVKSSFKTKLLTKLTTLKVYPKMGELAANSGDALTNPQEVTNYDEYTPEIKEILDSITDLIEWKNSDRPVPRTGVDIEYDRNNEKISKVIAELNTYLDTIRNKFSNMDICFAHTKHRYELEIPDFLVKGCKKPHNFEFSSKKKGVERFITPEIKDFVEKIETLEVQSKKILDNFACQVFGKFYQHRQIFERFIEAVARIDCLISLSLTSFASNGVMCRPLILPMVKKNALKKAFIEARSLRHPCIAHKIKNFIANDILLNHDNKGENVIILTGANMGGKSTILRQICLAAIMAQIGCYVPAEQFKFSAIDRIFTRLGSSDRLDSGKSTFFVEMEEVSNVVKFGTQNSLSIQDETGRGTSTSDGMSIAYGIINYLTNRIKCRTIFATHYHHLLQTYKENKNVKLCFMAATINNDEVKFEHKMNLGECHQSLGINVAKMCGLPRSVVEKAYQKANEFEKQHTGNKDLNYKFLEFMKVISDSKKNKNVFSLLKNI